MTSETTGGPSRPRRSRWLVLVIVKLSPLWIALVLGLFIRSQMSPGPGPRPVASVPVPSGRIAIATDLETTSDCLEWSKVNIIRVMDIGGPSPFTQIHYEYPGLRQFRVVAIPLGDYSQESMRTAICVEENRWAEETKRTEEANKLVR